MTIRPSPPSYAARLQPLLRAIAAAALLLALLAGLPAALTLVIGWPLPHHWPTTSQWRAFLTHPASTTTLLDTLALLTWATWVVFALDTLRAAPAALQALSQPGTPHLVGGPLHALAYALVWTSLTGLLQLRHTPPAAPSHLADLRTASVTASQQSAHTVVVAEPHDGIHDSLWRIAAQHLHDPTRWPEIYALNRGRPQPDGHALVQPSLIRPGWILRLPHPSENPRQHEHHTGQKTRPLSVPAAPAPPPPRPAPSPDPAAHAPRSAGSPTLAIGDGVLVSAGLAAAVSTALLLTRGRHRRLYQPDSGERDDLPIAPVIRELHLAHLHANPNQPPSTDTARPPHSDDDPDHPAALDTAQLLESAQPGGLGLVGPGAADAIRALILDLIATRHGPPTELVVTADLLQALFDNNTAPLAPVPRLLVADQVDQALDHLEAALLARTRAPAEHARLLLITLTPSGRSDRGNARLQAITGLGSTAGITGLFLGQWRAGASLLIDDSGTILAVSDARLDPLRTRRLPTMPRTEASQVLDLLRAAEGSPDSPPTIKAHRAAPTTATTPLPPGGSPHTDRPPRRPETDTAPLRLRILGTPQLDTQAADAQNLLSKLTKGQQELLLLLAVHPDGLTRAQLIEALWPTSTSTRPHNTAHNTISRLEQRLANTTELDRHTKLVLTGSNRYQLDPAQISIDYWTFLTAVTTRRLATSDADRDQACQQILDTYRGELAQQHTADWLDIPRETARRDAIDAATRLARTHINTQPRRALELLEQARTYDPYNEPLYLDIIRVQHRLGRPDAATRTLALLTTRLNEIGEKPSLKTIEISTQTI